jgi:hypothetical protein
MRINFNDATAILEMVDPELERLLSVVWGQASRARQRDLCFFLAKYPYKHFVFKNGQALDPDGRPLGADLLGTNRLPVGLILDNLLDVVDEVIGFEEVFEFPQRLLLKHQLIGLWEAVDEELARG